MDPFSKTGGNLVHGLDTIERSKEIERDMIRNVCR